MGQPYLTSWAANGWSLDGTAFLTHTGIRGAIVSLDGRVIALPQDMEFDGSNLSPDARYIVRGYLEGGAGYHQGTWQHFDIVDFDSGQVLWSLDTTDLQSHHWEWATPTHFAWSPGSGSSFGGPIVPPNAPTCPSAT